MSSLSPFSLSSISKISKFETILGDRCGVGILLPFLSLHDQLNVRQTSKYMHEQWTLEMIYSNLLRHWLVWMQHIQNQEQGQGQGQEQKSSSSLSLYLKTYLPHHYRWILTHAPDHHGFIVYNKKAKAVWKEDTSLPQFDFFRQFWQNRFEGFSSFRSLYVPWQASLGLSFQSFNKRQCIQCSSCSSWIPLGSMATDDLCDICSSRSMSCRSVDSCILSNRKGKRKYEHTLPMPLSIGCSCGSDESRTWSESQVSKRLRLLIK